MTRRAGKPTAHFTGTQGRYISFIHAYTKLHGRPPAESEIAAALCVSPPSVNQMVKSLEKKGATSFVATEFGPPGVPPSLRLAAQFWPQLFDNRGLISSRDFPPASAPVVHFHPRAGLGEVLPRAAGAGAVLRVRHAVLAGVVGGGRQRHRRGHRHRAAVVQLDPQLVDARVRARRRLFPPGQGPVELRQHGGMAGDFLIVTHPSRYVLAGSGLRQKAQLVEPLAGIAGQERAGRDTVGDVMSDAILVCRDKTPIVSAARTMTESGFRSVLVVDAKGKTLGVVSGRSLLPFVKNGVEGKLLVSDVMHPPLTIDIHASLREVANQDARATAYETYVRSALQNPLVVGTHWHQFGDQGMTALMISHGCALLLVHHTRLLFQASDYSLDGGLEVL